MRGSTRGRSTTVAIQKGFDFILALGDDSTDQEMFAVLPRQAYSIHVGASASHARFNLHDYGETIQLLETPGC
jgi:trehalose 6-phosphate synthase/phosphatase